MSAIQIRTAVYALAGLLIGYGTWILLAGAVITMTPVHLWVVAGGLALALMILFGVIMANRFRGTSAAAGFWAAPVLPVLACIYLLVVFANR